MTTTTLTLTKERPMAEKPRARLAVARERAGWNHKATAYTAVVVTVCVVVQVIHP